MHTEKLLFFFTKLLQFFPPNLQLELHNLEPSSLSTEVLTQQEWGDSYSVVTLLYKIGINHIATV